ncbi:MAG: sugar phosphate isomerase/epimerase, partial [Pseudomonadota bacterium]
SYEGLANEPEKMGDIAATLGSRFAILPWVGDDQRGLDDYKRHAEMMNRASEAMKSAGVRVAYHNHQFEFFDLGDGVTGMDILLSETDPDLVDMELDIFWAALAGVSIPDLFAAHPGRFKLCHVKDMKGDGSAYRTSLDFATIVGDVMANVGEGDIDFGALFKLNELSGLEYFVVEHDNPPRPFQQSVQSSYDNFRALRF